jgi:hypothetical protein
MLGMSLGLHKQIIPMPPTPLPLDNIDANMLYFSTAKLNSNDTLSIRVRRDLDNAEKDIGFIGKDLDTQTLLDFVGGGNGYIISTYSQGTVSSSQGLADSQPLIVENGVYLGTLKFSGAQWLDTGVTRFGNTGLFADGNEEFTVITVTKNEGTGTIIGRAVTTVAHRTFQTYFSTEDAEDYTLRIVARGARTDTSIHSSNENKIITCTWDKSNLSGYINGEFFPLEVGSATERTEQRIIVGARTNGSGFYYEGDITAFIILDKALTTEERQKLENYLNQQFNL